jgi:hypothetical protein
MNTTRYWVLAAGFCTLLATTFVFSQKSADSSHLYSALSPLPETIQDAGTTQADFCFDGSLLAVSCEYETMLAASGNAADIQHVVLAP